MVFTASHSSSLSCEMVGRFSAGSTASTAFEVVPVYVQHQPHFAQRVDGPAAASHVFQLAPLAASSHDARLAINCVFDSITVSMI